jgi:hypothetical protein
MATCFAPSGSIKPTKYRAESLPQKSPPVLAAGEDGEYAYLTLTNARKGRFRPKKRHPTRNPAETFQPSNDLGVKRPDPVT